MYIRHLNHNAVPLWRVLLLVYSVRDPIEYNNVYALRPTNFYYDFLNTYLHNVLLLGQTCDNSVLKFEYKISFDIGDQADNGNLYILQNRNLYKL